MISRDDQRNFIRMQLHAQAVIRYQESGQTHEIKGICHDLSATGLSLEVDREFAVGDELQVEVDGGVTQPLTADCRVLRSDADGEGYLLGCEITSLA